MLEWDTHVEMLEWDTQDVGMGHPCLLELLEWDTHARELEWDTHAQHTEMHGNQMWVSHGCFTRLLLYICKPFIDQIERFS